MILIKLIKNDIYQDFVNLRHRNGLTIYQVAKAIDISIDELDAIELNLDKRRCYKCRTLARFYNKRISVRLEDKENVKV